MPFSVLSMRMFLMKWNILPVPQTPDSPCLGPNFFLIFSKLKITKNGKRFQKHQKNSKCGMGTKDPPKNSRSTSRSGTRRPLGRKELVEKYVYFILQGNKARRK